MPSFYSLPNPGPCWFKKWVRLLSLSNRDEVLTQKVVHLDNEYSNVLPVQQFCGQSRRSPVMEENSGGHSETVGHNSVFLSSLWL